MGRRRTTRRRKPARRWTPAHVRRVFWRAGFGATREEARRWARRGRGATLDWLVEGDGPARLVGPSPSADGAPLDPVNEWDHDQLWWLDRMVRTTRPLEEKLTLLWHDHFATRDVATPLMLRQNETLRANALGPFPQLLRAVTLEPATQQFLTLFGSDKLAPNENFARELMELFTMGSGFTEADVREASRALTGFVEVRNASGQTTGVRFEPARHDDGLKTIFGRTGRWGWEDVLRLCVEHPAHAPFLVGRLWEFFVGTRLPKATRRSLVRVYRGNGLRIAPVVRRILAHDALYRDLGRPDMVKWPAVLVAGQLRAMGAPVDREAYARLMSSMGQTLFAPPSVAGWDWGPRWLSSNAMRARFNVANELLRPGGPAAVGKVPGGLSAAEHVRRAKAAVGRPAVTRATDLALERLAASFGPDPEGLQRALRHLLVSGPDNQLH